MYESHTSVESGRVVMRSRLMATVALLLVAVPAAVLVWVRLGVEDRLSGLHDDPEPVELVVAHREDVARRSVNVAVAWGDPEALLAPSWFGLVTSVGVGRGDVIGDGDEIAVIDGVSRVAILSPRPFHRFLGLNALGADVVMLQEVLERLGYLTVPTDGVFRQSTLTAVRAWAADLGVQGRVDGFDPGWVVWLPDDGFVIAEVTLTPGRAAPGLGEPIAASTRRIGSLAFMTPDGSIPSLDGLLILDVGGVSVPVINGELDDEALGILAEALHPDTDVITGTIRLAEPRLVLDVPAAAVVAGAGGELCVYRVDGSETVAVPVVVGSGRAGTVEIVSGLSDGDVVLANPGDVLDAPSCR